MKMCLHQEGTNNRRVMPPRITTEKNKIESNSFIDLNNIFSDLEAYISVTKQL